MDNYQSFFSQAPTPEIAKKLLGHKLIYDGPAGRTAGLIVETEAYLGEKDTASHAYGGRRTGYTESLYGDPGTLYIYQIRSYICLDIVAQAAEVPHGILIRAIEPTDGLAQMAANRGRKGIEISNGPGKLMQALGVDNRQLDGYEMAQAPLHIDLDIARIPNQIATGPRIGMRAGAASSQWPMRFYVAGNPYVSHTRRRDADLTNHGWRNKHGA